MAELSHTDMGFVAFLRMHGIEAIRIELAANGRNVQWVFQDGDKLTELMRDYFSGQTKVEPIEYNREYAKVRSQMNQFRNTVFPREDSARK